jgi:hypothetical protein
MRTISLVACVILTASMSAQDQEEKRPKMTLLHYANRAQYFEYGPDVLNIAELQPWSRGKRMPSDCVFRFGGIDRQPYILVEAECLGVYERRFWFKTRDAMKQYEKCKRGDVLDFQGKFRVVAGQALPFGGNILPIIESVDNNSSVMPAKIRPDLPIQK